MTYKHYLARAHEILFHEAPRGSFMFLNAAQLARAFEKRLREVQIAQRSIGRSKTEFSEAMRDIEIAYRALFELLLGAETRIVCLPCNEDDRIHQPRMTPPRATSR